jgi:hypothetical protein
MEAANESIRFSLGIYLICPDRCQNTRLSLVCKDNHNSIYCLMILGLHRHDSSQDCCMLAALSGPALLR